jgi:transcriptional regulator with PAS, ATPase and Fis domain
MLGLLAMVGVFYLFASAIGFVEFAQAGRAEDIGRSFVDQMSDGICILDEKGSIVYSNKAYGEMTGISGAEDLQRRKPCCRAMTMRRMPSTASPTMPFAAWKRTRSSACRTDCDRRRGGPRWYRASTRL